MKHNTKILGLLTIMMALTLALSIGLPNSSALAAPDTTVDVDGVWGIPEVGTDKEGANCDRWGTGPEGKPTAVSDTDPSIQNNAKGDENQFRYGAEDTSAEPPPCLDFAGQSGFGFDGVEGTTMHTDGTPFRLGTFTHYNYVTNGDLKDYNPPENVGLTITLSGSVDALLKCHVTIVETTNDDVPCMFPEAPNDPPCGEKIAIAAQPLLTSIIPIEGKLYIVEILGFTDCDAPGKPNKILYTHEQAADKACMYARLVALPTSP